MTLEDLISTLPPELSPIERAIAVATLTVRYPRMSPELKAMELTPELAAEITAAARTQI